jgi:hypothetical protein
MSIDGEWLPREPLPLNLGEILRVLEVKASSLQINHGTAISAKIIYEKHTQKTEKARWQEDIDDHVLQRENPLG